MSTSFKPALPLLILTVGVSACATQRAADRSLSDSLLHAVRHAHFEKVIDYGPFDEACPGKSFCPPRAPRIAHMPNIDLAVIELSPTGEYLDAANVIVSRDHPHGVIVPLDRNSGANVNFLRWDIARWDGGTFSSDNGQRLTSRGWMSDPPLAPSDSIVPGREQSPIIFMSPYPASLFKLLVAAYTMRLVDESVVALDDIYDYQPPGEPKESRKVRAWLDPMITESDNHSARAMLKMLHDLSRIDGLNLYYERLGLPTLQIHGTNPTNGYTWTPGLFHMTAFDTARLLWLIEGGPALWHAPATDVRATELSASSRTFLLGLLKDQGLHEALSTTNICGAPATVPGIPALIAERWIDPVTHAVTADGTHFGRDVRPCQQSAEVLFAHKTGETFNYASDAGIVTSLPGKPGRHYIIAFFANVGSRYADPEFASRKTPPCSDALTPICYTQRIPAMAREIDLVMQRRAARRIEN